MTRLLARLAGAAVLCAIATPAFADDVLYKCIDDKGAVSIQSSACPKGSKQAWKRDTAAMAAAVESAPMAPKSMPAITAASPPAGAPAGTPAVPPAPAAQSLAPAAVESLAPIGPEAGAVAPSAPVDPCDQAKDLAAQLRDLPWLELSSEQQKRLMDWVMQQCRPASSNQQ